MNPGCFYSMCRIDPEEKGRKHPRDYKQTRNSLHQILFRQFCVSFNLFIPPDVVIAHLLCH